MFQQQGLHSVKSDTKSINGKQTGFEGEGFAFPENLRKPEIRPPVNTAVSQTEVQTCIDSLLLMLVLRCGRSAYKEYS